MCSLYSEVSFCNWKIYLKLYTVIPKQGLVKLNKSKNNKSAIDKIKAFQTTNLTFLNIFLTN